MKSLYLFYLLSVACISFSQTVKDTSYTVNSTYIKELKKYPFIKKVSRPKNDKLQYESNIVYKATGLRKLHMDVCYSSTKSQPGIVLIHGGGWKSGDKSGMQYLAQELALKGYACFSVEYRLSPEAKYPAGIYDIKTSIKYIRENAAKFNVDGSRIAVLGCSSGGQIAALTGATNNNPQFEEADGLRQSAAVQAIIDMDGVLAFHHPESVESEVAAMWLGGSYDKEPKIWEQASALTHSGKNTPPVLFIGSDKPRFLAGRSDMIAKLDRFGIYNEVHTITGSPHSFWFFEPWFDDIVAWSASFLDKVFKQE